MKKNEPSQRPGDTSSRGSGRHGRVTLKDVARLADVSTATVSLVLNQAPKADSIPDDTQHLHRFLRALADGVAFLAG